jgi:hypothetical protein
LPEARTPLHRALAAGYCAAPILLALVLYWPGLTAWFQMDDFSLLSLRDQVTNWPTFWRALFAPVAQGTIRTLSERVFYMSFTAAFGLHAIPFRIWAFLTFAATLPLLSAVTTRLTRSRAAGFWAAILLTVNSGIAVALSWTAVYYELLCAFIFLLNFWLLLRYVETGKLRFYVAQCIVFLLGFGVLELNVVYPALATMYALCCARQLLPKIAPLFLASAAYTIAHSVAAPLSATGPYRMHWDLSILSTLWTYWNWALEPSRLEVLHIGTPLLRDCLGALLGAALVAFLVWKLRQRQWVVAIFPAWFLIVLAPLLPLRDHIMDYYLSIPVIGLAMWGAWALVSAWRAGSAGRIAAVLLLAIYLSAAIPVTRATTLYFHQRGERTRALVLGVAAIARTEPTKLLLLTGVDDQMFWTALNHWPFRLFTDQKVQVLPENAAAIGPGPQQQDPQIHFIERDAARFALARNRAVVIDVSDDHPREITAQYVSSAGIRKDEAFPPRLNVASDELADLLGPSWYPNEGGFRWMPKRATVTLHGPLTPAAKLYLTGRCPAAIVKSGPLRMNVSVDGVKLAPATLSQPDAAFSLVFDLPPQLAGRGIVEIAVELDRVFIPPADPRPLGLAFGTFEIR